MILNLNQEFVIRLSVFAGVLVLMMVWEQFSPRRAPGNGKWLRRGNNLLLVMIDTLLVMLIFRLVAVGAAEMAAVKGWGLFNNINLPYGAAFILSFLILDLLIYTQHVVFHRVNVLWRVHRVHHTDKEFDTTTAVRFHPIEILISMVIKMAAVLILGAPVMAVMLFEIVLNAGSMFNHGNVRIPIVIDRYLRWFIVTPDMHRIHHSVIRDETDSNYGFNLPWWGRLFHTYRDQPGDGHQRMQIGLNEFSGMNTVNVLWLLLQPFLDPIKIEKTLGDQS